MKTRTTHLRRSRPPATPRFYPKLIGWAFMVLAAAQGLAQLSSTFSEPTAGLSGWTPVAFGDDAASAQPGFTVVEVGADEAWQLDIPAYGTGPFVSLLEAPLPVTPQQPFLTFAFAEPVFKAEGASKSTFGDSFSVGVHDANKFYLLFLMDEGGIHLDPNGVAPGIVGLRPSFSPAWEAVVFADLSRLSNHQLAVVVGLASTDDGFVASAQFGRFDTSPAPLTKEIPEPESILPTFCLLAVFAALRRLRRSRPASRNARHAPGQPAVSVMTASLGALALAGAGLPLGLEAADSTPPPARLSVSAEPDSALGPSWLRFQYERSLSPAPFVYELEHSPDLAGWITVPPTDLLPLLVRDVPERGLEEVQFGLHPDLLAPDSGFFQLKASSAPMPTVLGRHLTIEMFGFSDPTSAVQAGGIFHDPWSGTSTASLKVVNTSSAPLGKPLLLVVDKTEPPEVRAVSPDGAMPGDGRPYFDLSGQVPGEQLAPGQATYARPLTFANPAGVPFSIEASVVVWPSAVRANAAEPAGLVQIIVPTDPLGRRIVTAYEGDLGSGGLVVKISASGPLPVGVRLTQSPVGGSSRGRVCFGPRHPHIPTLCPHEVTVSAGGGITAEILVRGDPDHPSAYHGDLELVAFVDGVLQDAVSITVVRMTPAYPAQNLVSDIPMESSLTTTPETPDLTLEVETYHAMSRRPFTRPLLSGKAEQAVTIRQLDAAGIPGPVTTSLTTGIDGIARYLVQAGPGKQDWVCLRYALPYTYPAPEPGPARQDASDPADGTQTCAGEMGNSEECQECCEKQTGGRGGSGGACGTASGPAPGVAAGLSASPGSHMAGIALYTGSLSVTATDLAIEGRGFDYEFVRCYDTQVSHLSSVATGDFGRQWVFNYSDDRLIPDLNNVILHRANHGQYQTTVFIAVNEAGDLMAPAGVYDELRRLDDGRWQLRTPYGFKHLFAGFDHPSIPGRLLAIQDRNGNTMTFFYDRIDPDGEAENGDEKFVFTRVFDTLGREIRYQYYAQSAQTTDGRQLTREHPHALPAAWGRLAQVSDFKGNMDFTGAAESEDFPGQANNRTLVFDYDAEGQLVRASRPAVRGTPNGNDFPEGKTYRYRYLGSADLPAGLNEVDRARLLHSLTHIWYPNEVGDAPDTQPPASQAAEVFTFGMVPGDPANFDHIIAVQDGGVNGSGVPAGGTTTYAYEILAPESPSPNHPYIRVHETDRMGNVTDYVFSSSETLIEKREYTRGLRQGEPEAYVTGHSYNYDRELVASTDPQGNSSTYEVNGTAEGRAQQGNTGRITRTAGAAGGDQTTLASVTVYEPIFNQVYFTVDPRGVGGYAPPIRDPADRDIADPYDPDHLRSLNLRYARFDYYDYQESPTPAGAWPATASSPLALTDSLATEVLMLRELGLPETEVGLDQLRRRLEASLVRLGLGDLNADGLTDPALGGNIVRTIWGSPVLINGSNQHALESQVDPVDLINASREMLDGGPQEGAAAGRLQTIVRMTQYNRFGQPGKEISPEGNVTLHEYFPENDPDGDSHLTPAPTDGRVLAGDTGGYRSRTIQDAQRSYLRDDGSPSTGEFSNNLTNPQATEIISSRCQACGGAVGYDDIGNAISSLNGRGIRTDYFVNELGQTVQVTRAADVSGAATANPPDPLVGDPVGPLTAFAYRTRVAYDHNNNIVLQQVEDRGDTSNTGGFVDSTFAYDMLGNLVQDTDEVDISTTLVTRYRYDANENRVMTIRPAGNADSAVYDERNLLFQSTRGANARPAAGLFAAGDPTTFDRPGGVGTEPSTTTYNYDGNGNLIELVDAQHHGGTQSAIAGIGDVTQYEYDGFDRRKRTIDPLGNVTSWVYDPAGNVVRVIQDGDPVDDGPGDADNKTLAVTETIYDELDRAIAIHRVLFMTPDVTTVRPVDIDDTAEMDPLAPYLADAETDTATVPDAVGINVIGRVTGLAEYDRESRGTFQVEDDLGNARTDYDGAGRSVKTTDCALSTGFSGGVFDPGQLDGNTVQIAYDDGHNAIERLETDVTDVPNIAPEYFRTTYAYDALDRVQTEYNNLGYTTDYRYDSRGNRVAQADAQGPVGSRAMPRRGLGSTAAVSLNDFGNVTRWCFDGMGRLFLTEQILTADNNGDGLHIGATLEGVKATPPTPDPAKDAEDNGRIHVFKEWDANSQLLTLTDDNGFRTYWTYDNQDRQLAETKGIRASTINLTCLDAPTALRCRCDYDPDHYRCDPPTTTDYTFDLDSNVARVWDENGSIVTRTYDARNRHRRDDVQRAGNEVPRKDAAASFPAVVGTTLTTITYDGLSRMTRGTDNNDPLRTNDDTTITSSYDSLHRRVQETQHDTIAPPSVVSSAYRAEGLRTALIYPDNLHLTCTFDPLNRLDTVVNAVTTLTVAAYDFIGASRLLRRLTPDNGTRWTYLDPSDTHDIGYDAIRRPRLTQHLRSDTTLIVGYAISYSRMNDVTTSTMLHEPLTSRTYQYDSARRLRSMDSARTPAIQNTTLWTMDGPGNWPLVTTLSPATPLIETRVHSCFNEVLCVSGDPPQFLAYDDSGNLISRADIQLLYDYKNRLVRVHTASATLEYARDVMSRCLQVRRTTAAASQLRHRAFVRWQLLEDHDMAQPAYNAYIYGTYIDEPLCLDTRAVGDLSTSMEEERRYYHCSAFYTVDAMTTSDGRVAALYDYDPYGKQYVLFPVARDACDIAISNRVGYTGREYDCDLALWDFRVRYYSDSLGRFVSRDAVGTRMAEGSGSYCNAFAVSGVDPFGMWAWGTVEIGPLQVSATCEPFPRTDNKCWCIVADLSATHGTPAVKTEFDYGAWKCTRTPENIERTRKHEEDHVSNKNIVLGLLTTRLEQCYQTKSTCESYLQIHTRGVKETFEKWSAAEKDHQVRKEPWPESPELGKSRDEEFAESNAKGLCTKKGVAHKGGPQ